MEYHLEAKKKGQINNVGLSERLFVIAACSCLKSFRFFSLLLLNRLSEEFQLFRATVRISDFHEYQSVSLPFSPTSMRLICISSRFFLFSTEKTESI